jgi:hypothetical protein
VGSGVLLSVEPGSGFTPMDDLSFSDGLDFSVGLDVGFTRSAFGVVGLVWICFPALGTTVSGGSGPGIGDFVEGGCWGSSPKAL